MIEEKKMLFWIHLAVLAATNIVFTIFGSADVQSWDSEEGEEELEMESTTALPRHP